MYASIPSEYLWFREKKNTPKTKITYDTKLQGLLQYKLLLDELCAPTPKILKS